MLCSRIPSDKISLCHNLNNNKIFFCFFILSSPKLPETAIHSDRYCFVNLKFKYLIFLCITQCWSDLVKNLKLTMYINWIMLFCVPETLFFEPRTSDNSDWCFPYSIMGQKYKQVYSSLTKTFGVVLKTLQQNL